MKRGTWLFFILFQQTIWAQNHGVEVNVGVNKMGIGYDLGYAYDWGNNQMILGTRIYAPSFVFSKFTPGISLKYLYNLIHLNERGKLFLGLSGQGFRENKVNQFTVLNIMPFVGFGIEPVRRIQWRGYVGLGIVQNRIRNKGTDEIEKWRFNTIECTVSMCYRIGRID